MKLFRIIGISLISISIGCLYLVLFKWDGEDNTKSSSLSYEVNLPDGHPSISNGGRCPMGYDNDDETSMSLSEPTCEQLFNRDWHDSALTCVRKRRDQRANDAGQEEGYRLDDELERLILDAL